MTEGFETYDHQIESGLAIEVRVRELGILIDQEVERNNGYPNAYSRQGAFKELIEYGESALPELLADIEHFQAWRSGAIAKIARDIEDPINFRGAQGNEDLVRDRILTWAEEHGYLPGSY